MSNLVNEILLRLAKAALAALLGAVVYLVATVQFGASGSVELALLLLALRRGLHPARPGGPHLGTRRRAAGPFDSPPDSPYRPPSRHRTDGLGRCSRKRAAEPRAV